MRPDEQRIAIAEWCGWRHEYDTKQLKSVWISPKSGYAYDTLNDMVPDYLNDLNAMHEAENKLDRDGVVRLRLDYGSNLFRIVCPEPSMSRQWETWVTLHATAAQRAEALLRTIGKWVDSTLHTKGEKL